MATALLSGTIIDDGGLPCEGSFEYGYSPAFGFTTPWRNNLRTGDSFQERIINLRGGITIYFRARARNAVGTTLGLTLTFVTVARIPVVVTTPATNISTGGATLNGLITDDMGAGCDCCFEYGGTTAYGSRTPWVSGYVTGSAFSDDIVGLKGGESFHYRAVARNRYGIGYGQDVTFTTRSNMGAMTGITMELLLLTKEES